MAITPKWLADGQAAATQTAIYTVGSDPATVVGGMINLHNTNAGIQAVTVAVNGTGTIRTIHKLSLLQNDSAIVDIPVLNAGDIVYLTTTTGSALNYVFHGGLVTA